MRLGPSMPPSSAVERLQLERDALDQSRADERSMRDSQRKKGNRESREEEKDNRATGKDRLIEKRREGNLSRKEFAAEREGGGMVEVSEEVLMGGGGGGFQDALKERERAKMRWEEKRGGQREEQKAVMYVSIFSLSCYRINADSIGNLRRTDRISFRLSNRKRMRRWLSLGRSLLNDLVRLLLNRLDVSLARWNE